MYESQWKTSWVCIPGFNDFIMSSSGLIFNGRTGNQVKLFVKDERFHFEIHDNHNKNHILNFDIVFNEIMFP
jgi:hypothetical protein